MNPFAGLFSDSATAPAPARSVNFNMSGSNSDPFSSLFAPEVQANNNIQDSFQNEQAQLKQQLNPNTINDPKQLQQALHNGQISQQQFLDRFKQLQGPSPLAQQSGTKTFLDALGQGAKSIGQGFIQSEQTAANAGARLLPGGQNDLQAENQATDQNVKNLQFIQGLRDTGKINDNQARTIINKVINPDIAQNAQSIEQSKQSIPSPGRAAASVAGTAADILTGGALPELKGATTAAKLANEGIQAGSYGAAAGLNAAAGGGTKKQIAENAIAGAAFPVLLKGLPKTAEAVQAATGKDRAVNDLINNTRTQQALEGNLPRGTRPTPNVKSGAMFPLRKLNETGTVEPGKALADTKAFIEQHQTPTKFNSSVERGAYSAEGTKKLIQQDALKLLKERPQLSNADKQLLQDYRDAKAAGLQPPELPTHLQQYDAAVTALNKESQKADAELARLNGNEAKAKEIEARNPETYTHREARGKGSALDYLLQRDRKSPLSVGGFSKTTPASKNRTFMALTDENGNRRVVAIKNSVLKTPEGKKLAQGKLVTAIDNGGKTTEKLGKLKFNTNQDFLDKELRPYQTKITNLTKEGNALAKVSARGGASEARIEALAKKAALLEDPGNMSGLTKTEAKSLREAQIKLRELLHVKPSTTNATGRLETVNRKLMQLQNEVNRIEEKYDPEKLDNKIFVGKDGKTYTLGQATQSEITKATGQKYYVDPHLMALKNYVEARSALENARFIEAVKSDPHFEDVASAPGTTAPKGWKPAPQSLPQLRGYRFDPKVADTLEAIAEGYRGQNALDKTGKLLRQTIVYFPVKHDLNMLAAYATDRGLSGIANPVSAVRGAKALYAATREVINQGPIYRELLKNGFGLVTADDKAFQTQFQKELDQLVNDKATLAEVAKQLGTTPKRLIKAYNSTQHATVWMVQDVLNVARVMERMQGGLLKKPMSLQDAMKQAERFNYQYRVPARVAGSTNAAKLLKSPLVFFGRYKYDQFKILGNIMKDSINIAHPKQAAQAWDKLAALLAISLIVWPEVDKGIQAITGNKNAYIKAPGPAEIPETIAKVRKGNESASTAVSNQLYLGPIQQAMDIKNNTDSFTGQKIYDPNASPEQQGKSIMSWIAGQVAPIQHSKSLSNTAGNRVVDIGLMLSGATFPKNSPETNKLNSLKYDTMPKVQTGYKQLVQQGNPAAAKALVDQYNQQVLQAAKAALQAANKPVPSDQRLLFDLKKGYFLYNPSAKTTKRDQGPQLNTLDKLLRAQP